MKRVELGLLLIGLDLKNARSRQKFRLKQERLEALAIDETLSLATMHLRELKSALRKLQKLEKIESKIKQDDRKPKREAGLNLRLLGTYGKQ
jgi:hypothetical protein